MTILLYWLEYDIQRDYVYAYKNDSFEGYIWGMCQECGRQTATARYTGYHPHLLLEGSGLYPDFLQFCGAGNRLFVISERALYLFERHGISGYSNYIPVSLDTSLVSPKAKTRMVPNYFSLEVSGHIDLDFKLMHLKRKKLCPICHQFEWSRQKIDPIVADNHSWDGSDLCILSSMPGFIMCSKTIVNIVHDNDLTGVSFRS